MIDFKKWRLIQEAMRGDLTTEKEEAVKAQKEYRCYQCPEEKKCPFAWDAYNIGNDYCLAEK